MINKYLTLSARIKQEMSEIYSSIERAKRHGKKPIVNQILYI
ncbi:MAG: hypothetical protein ACOX8P_06690 [Tepidanaerobacteraceae bacterium]